MEVPEITKPYMELFLSEMIKAFGKDEAEKVVKAWQEQGYQRFTEMSVEDRWHFFVFFTEIFYDAKRQ